MRGEQIERLHCVGTVLAIVGVWRLKGRASVSEAGKRDVGCRKQNQLFCDDSICRPGYDVCLGMVVFRFDMS